MGYFLYFILLFGAWLFYFVIYLHLEYAWLFPSYTNSANVKSFSEINTIYDYIVVGAGSAGCVLAHRLSQNRSMSVLLIEAGPVGSAILDVPAVLPLLQRSSVDWTYQTTPQTKSFQSFSDFKSNWPRGKIVGGSGRLNNMIYVRGHPQDYVNLFDRTKIDVPEEILQSYWKRGENQQGSRKNELHGSGGPLYASDIVFRTQLSHSFEEAVKELGIVHRDINIFHTGFDLPQVNIRNGARFSTGHYLLEQLDTMPNMHLLTNAEVIKVGLFHNWEARTVTVVDNLKKSSPVEISARYGIVLSAGAINTPKLLQLSGIGDPQHLQSIGIPVSVALPDVGHGLQDHVGATMDLVSVSSPLELNAYSLLNPLSLFNYVMNGQGVYTSIQCEGIIIAHIDCLLNATGNTNAFEKCEESLQDTPPDFQMMALPLGITTDYAAQLYKILGINPIVYNEFYAHFHGTPTVLLVPIVLHPRSRGYVLISTADPSQPPIINPNYLADTYDIDIILKGVRFMQQIVGTPAMRKLGAQIDSRPFPACTQHAYDTDEYWTCYIRHITLTIYHPIGTAELGKVVDFNFKVMHTNKLFVADGSVLPNMPSGNPNAAIVTVAEIAADAIKREVQMSLGRSTQSDRFVVKHSTSIFT